MLALTAYSQNPKGFGPEAAREQIKALKTPDNLEVSLFASEPMVRNPANMDVDAKGRVWVTEGVNYRMFQKWGKLRPEGDRIVILEDSDGDGAADKEKTFYQGDEINTALGICVLGDKVIVSCSPNILIFKDENHDDKADGKPEIMFTGISGKDHDHGAHAFVFGPDGKLYFNIGNEGKQIKTPDGKLVVDRFGHEVITNGKPYRQGLVFRLNEDGSDFQTLAWNFRNNYEVCVDSLGSMWQSDNDDDGNKGVRINFVMENGNYGYTDEMTGAGWGAKRSNMETEIPLRHWHLNDPGVVPNLLQTGAGSPTGILFYEGKLLPKEFQNQIIHCDAGPRVVRAYSVVPSGAGYNASIINILTTDDSWFRPSDVCVAPDGSLYVADWNDAGVGGHYMADQKLETMTGRVYHVTPKGKKGEAPKLDLSTPAGAVNALQSPNQATRYLAWHAVHNMGEKAEGALKKVWNGDDLMLRARAWNMLVRIPGKEEQYLNAAIKDKNENIRNLAVRYARVENKNTIPIIKKLVKDPSPAVRRECAISLYQNKSSEAPELWAELAAQHDGKDRWYLEALGNGARGQEDRFFAAWLDKNGEKIDTAAERDIVWRSRSKQSLPLIVKIISDKNTPESERARFFRALDFIQGPEKDAALLQLIQ
jgi:putative membrane-bound dehydrogenase-like protein